MGDEHYHQQQLVATVANHQDDFNRASREGRWALVRALTEHLPGDDAADTTGDWLFSVLEANFRQNVLMSKRRGRDYSTVPGNVRLQGLLVARSRECFTEPRSEHLRIVREICAALLQDGIQFWLENRDGTWIRIDPLDDNDENGGHARNEVYHRLYTTLPTEEEMQRRKGKVSRAADGVDASVTTVEAKPGCHQSGSQDATAGEVVATEDPGAEPTSKRPRTTAAHGIPSNRHLMVSHKADAVRRSRPQNEKKRRSNVPAWPQNKGAEHPSKVHQASLHDRVFELIHETYGSNLAAVTRQCTAKLPDGKCHGVTPTGTVTGPPKRPKQNGHPEMSAAVATKSPEVPRSPTGPGFQLTVQFQCGNTPPWTPVACTLAYTALVGPSETVPAPSMPTVVGISLPASLPCSAFPEESRKVRFVTHPSTFAPPSSSCPTAVPVLQGNIQPALGIENAQHVDITAFPTPPRQLNPRGIVGRSNRHTDHDRVTSAGLRGHALQPLEILLKLCAESRSVFMQDCDAGKALQDILSHCSGALLDSGRLQELRSSIVELSMLGRKSIDHISKVLVAHTYNPTIQSLGAQVFSFLAEGGPRDVIRILEGVGLKMIVLCMEKYPYDAELQLHGCQLLVLLASQCADEVHRFMKRFQCESLLNLAGANHPQNEELCRVILKANVIIPTG